MRYVYLIIILIFSNNLYAKDYTKNIKTKFFIKDMVDKYNFSKDELNILFSNVIVQKQALARYVRKPRPKITHTKKKPINKIKRVGSWDRYEAWILKRGRINRGAKYMKKYKIPLEKAYNKFGLPPEYITAIIGIESYYGKNTGKFPVLDTLTTLAFESNRKNNFFKHQLKSFLLMTKKEKVNPKVIKGSIAGAIGLCQFMPSNYEKLAIDFNGDGRKQMNNHIDAIGSIAHYFKQNHWKKGEEVAVRVKYKGNRFKKLKTGYKYKYHRSYLKGISPITPFNYHGKVSLIKLKRTKYDELWYGAKNFFVITRYNHSNYYAMAVYQLAKKIKEEYKSRYLNPI